MLLGCHAGVITPPLPVPMGGYGARSGPAEGVHDDLFVRTLVFQDGPSSFVLMTADLLAFSRDLTARVRAAVTAATEIPPERVMVAASHTHAGPTIGGSLFGPPPEAYLHWLPAALAGSAYQAARRLGPVELAAATGQVSGLGTNRTDPALPLDDSARLLAAAAPDGRLQAVLLQYACHPTVLGPEHRLISADWPGAAVGGLGRFLGPGPWVGFVQGAAGDVSTRFLRRRQDFAEAERLGSLLAAAAVALLAGVRYVPPPEGTLAVASRTVRLEPRPLPDPAEAARRVDAAGNRLQAALAAGAAHGAVRLAQTALEGARVEALLAAGGADLEYDCEVQAVRLAPDIALVGVAGELFSALGRDICARSPFAHTLVCGYAGGLAGYLPDRAAFARGGYEASSAHTAAGSGEQLAEVAHELLIRLAKAGG